ncbi:PPOX class F420-dependent oxidoreductase [Streptomyces sp. CBMA29]|uniref:PPOX class F420-dependent oxidoreductase n=1 Tax=Streptomyces sp. CBMA29 TaxID=1896314 RepID=UPI0016618B73|nr:PPOX class F420-dependent oxidoreductase [Streptomyces sp. CBMA29]MBD0737158.1 PPOX class F420-dependent enzyme [Streptomyces sp. CBMA29]
MQHMTEAEWRAFASTGTRTGKLAVQRKDGGPHVTPVWFLLDDTDPSDIRVVFNTGSDSLKGRALRRDARFALCVDDQEPPYSFVLFECTAELVEDPAALLLWSTKIGSRYMGSARGAEFGARNAVPGEYLVRGRINRVTAQAAVAD